MGKLFEMLLSFLLKSPGGGKTELRSRAVLVLVCIGILFSIALGGQMARFTPLPQSFNLLNQRVIACETTNSIQDQKLTDITATLERIDRNTQDTRREIAMLTTALIQPSAPPARRNK